MYIAKHVYIMNNYMFIENMPRVLAKCLRKQPYYMVILYNIYYFNFISVLQFINFSIFNLFKH